MEKKTKSESAVCTIFEGSYHLGVGALANSLWRCGFRGVIWAGYRGELPPWAHGLEEREGYSEYRVDDGCVIRFLPIEADIHLAHYKPSFMRGLCDRYLDRDDSIFYFDPDIVIRCAWEYFEEWVSLGVAMCEDLHSPMNPTHPLRLRWKKFFEKEAIALHSTLHIFVNSGFLGVSACYREFLSEWERVIEIMKPHTGGLKSFHLGSRTLLFQLPDQDALNIVVYSTSCELSVMGRESMDFVPGGYVMSHAAGATKPWNKKMIRSALCEAKAPTMADKEYWSNVETPIALFSAGYMRLKKLDLRVGAAIGRFIRRS